LTSWWWWWWWWRSITIFWCCGRKSDWGKFSTESNLN